MDGREAMALPGGSAHYYIHRGGIGGSVSGAQVGAFNASSGYRPLTNPNILAQSNVRQGSSGSTFSIEPSQNANFSHGFNVGTSSGVPPAEPVKKKRGRPRKYAPDGQVSLGLSPMSAPAKLLSGSSSPSEKRARGRPPGSGRKQRLANLGEWMNSSAGLAFAPHVITIGVGEDVVEKLLSFSQQRPRALCIMSGTGTVSLVTLLQPASTVPAATYEGRFEILCLSGSYLVAEDGGPRNRTGGISVSLARPDGYAIGGAAAELIAASPVQVVVCSFVYGSSKTKTKQVTTPAPKSNKESTTPPSNNKSAAPNSAPPTQNFTPNAVGMWPGSRPGDLRNAHMDIDLTRG